MRKITYLTVFTLLFAVQAINSTAFAQHRAQCTQPKSISEAKLDAIKFKHIVKVLELSKADSIAFKAIYDDYRLEIKANIKKYPKGDEVKSMNLLSDKELTDAMLVNFNNISAAADIKAEYISKFSKVLTARQIQKLYKVEGMFSQRLKGASNKRSMGNSKYHENKQAAHKNSQKYKGSKGVNKSPGCTRG